MCWTRAAIIGLLRVAVGRVCLVLGVSQCSCELCNFATRELVFKTVAEIVTIVTLHIYDSNGSPRAWLGLAAGYLLHILHLQGGITNFKTRRVKAPE